MGKVHALKREIKRNPLSWAYPIMVAAKWGAHIVDGQWKPYAAWHGSYWRLIEKTLREMRYI